MKNSQLPIKAFLLIASLSMVQAQQTPSTKPANAGEEATATSKAAPTAHRSIFDRAKSNKSDYIVVPAGTEIRVDIVESKVIAPVRVGFATPIPPMSVAGVKVNKHYFAPISYNVSSETSNNQSGIYSETGELTSVTVRGVTYPVQARTVPLNGGATYGTAASIVSSRDAVFVLTAPLQIER